MKRNGQRFFIGDLAKLAGVKPDSVRFYEKSNLLPEPERNESGYRVYKEDALKRLKFIKQAQSLGFSLEEVRRILSLRGQGAKTCACVFKIAEATLSETEEKLRELKTFRDTLKENLERWKAGPGKGHVASEFCALIESSAPPLKNR